MNNFDDNTISQLKSMVQHFNKNTELLSYNEVLLDNKLTTFLLKQNAKLKKVVDLYSLLKKCEDELKNLNFDTLENSQERNNLVAQIDELKNKIVLCLNSQSSAFEDVTMQIINKSNENRFVDFIKQGIEACCKNLELQIAFTEEENMLCAQISGFGALSAFKKFAGIHRAKFMGKQIDAYVYVFLSPISAEFDLSDKSIKVDVFKSAGHGGQGVNTTDSAVRITHLKTKVVAECQDERSQIQNKEKALEILKQKLLKLDEKNKNKYIYDAKKEQVKQIEHGFVCKFYDFDKKIVTEKNASRVVSFEDFLNGKI